MEIKRILYATDLSPNSVYALRFALSTAKNHHAEIIILHVLEQVYPHIVPLLDVYITGKEQKSLIEERIAQTRAIIGGRLKRVIDENARKDPAYEALDLSIELCEGFPAERILRTASEYNCDLILMGTHGKGAIAHTFLGSTAKRVLRRTHKPVFIIPLPADLPDDIA
ncbi:MAG: universal stress protein [Deltaproteobacteria bacterium]|nr:universal stress protein [Deltaproteobacteria bacterium]